MASQDIDVDWSVPESFVVSDGTGADIDTTNSLTQLAANWTASADTNSGIVKYWYAIGTTAGATDVVSWTNNNLLTSVTHTGLTLLPNQLYYFSVKSEDGAGLQSLVYSSDAQLAHVTSVDELVANYGLYIYPNPFTGSTIVTYQLAENTKAEISITDVLGKKIVVLNNEQPQGTHKVEVNAAALQLAKGMYFVKLKTSRGEGVVKVVVQ